MSSIKVELAHVEGDTVFVVAALAHQAAVHLTGSLMVGGRAHDVTANLVRFPRHEPNAVQDVSHGILIGKWLPPDPPGADLAGQEAVLMLSNPAGEQFQARLQLRHEPAAFRRMATTYDRVLRALLEQASREEAYLLETQIWPEVAERAEVADLAELGPEIVTDIEFCCMPLPGVLLIVGHLVDPLHQVVAIDVFHGDNDEPYERRLLRYEPVLSTAEPRDLRSAGGFLIVLEFNEAEVAQDDFVLLLATRTRVWTRSLPQPTLDRGLDRLQAQMRDLDADARLLIVEELARLAVRRGDRAAGLALFALQTALSAELPASLSRPACGLRLNVDLAAVINGHGVFLMGWAALEPELVRGVELCVPGPDGGVRCDVSGSWVLHPRMDVWRTLKAEGEQIMSDQLGFICVARTAAASISTVGYLAVHMLDGGIRRMTPKLHFAAVDPIEAIKPLLIAFPQTHLRLRVLLDRHIGPAITALWSQRRLSSRAPDINEYGAVPTEPECSVIVPLYGRYDFLEHQLARFADDPALRGQELIYVIDDPMIYDAVRQVAPDLAQLYDLPFRLVYAGRNLGFAGATNLGASQARGEYLLLMNSDVMPRRFHWLRELIAAYRRVPKAGALGPKLLYEDQSIQHAGMRFVRYQAWGDMWVNEHPGKGLTDQLGDAPIPCDALSGACLLIETALYHRVGGLSEDYIIGDFEDSDLCLKLLQAGRRNWLIPSVALYHLERQSQSLRGEADWRSNLTLLNCWTHHQRWDAIISDQKAAQ
jgi:GT2 family glycosyltransferase